MPVCRPGYPGGREAVAYGLTKLSHGGWSAPELELLTAPPDFQKIANGLKTRAKRGMPYKQGPSRCRVPVIWILPSWTP
jgi:hypothetical protein